MYRLAKSNLDKQASKRYKQHEHRKKQPTKLAPGTRVYLRKRAPGRNKIQSYWNPVPY